MNSKLRIQIITLLIVWSCVFLLYPHRFELFSGFFIIWCGVVLSTMIVGITHFHFKKWGPEISEELEKMNLKFIHERPLTLFESAQFADTVYFLEIFSINFKRIVKVELEDKTKEMCLRINKNFFTDSIKITVIGEV